MASHWDESTPFNALPHPLFFLFHSRQHSPFLNGILIGGLIKIYEYWETRALKKKSKSCCNKSGKEVLSRDKVMFLDAALKDLSLLRRKVLFKSSYTLSMGPIGGLF